MIVIANNANVDEMVRINKNYKQETAPARGPERLSRKNFLTVVFPHRARLARGTFRLFYFEIDAGVVFDADYSQKRTDCFGCRSLAADNLSHILRADPQRKKNSHFVNFPFNFDFFRVVYERFNNIFKEFLIVLRHLFDSKLLF